LRDINPVGAAAAAKLKQNLDSRLAMTATGCHAKHRPHFTNFAGTMPKAPSLTDFRRIVVKVGSSPTADIATLHKDKFPGGRVAGRIRLRESFSERRSKDDATDLLILLSLMEWRVV
jgi:hypothetical protein